MYLNYLDKKFYYEIHGDVINPAIIFCHGVSMDHESFKPQIECLKENYCVITWDMPFHGKSGKIDYKSNFGEVSADIITKILDAHGIK